MRLSWLPNLPIPEISLPSVVNHIFNVSKQDFGDLAIGSQNFDGRFAERHGAAQVVNFPANTAPVVRDNFHVFTVEHSLQLFHHRKKIIHGL